MNSTINPPPLGPPLPPDQTGPGDTGPGPTGPPPSRPARPPLRRSATDRRLGGVAGGLAEFFDLDPTLVRAALVLVAIASAGFGLCAYAAAWLLLPAGDEHEAIAPRWYRRHGSSTAGVVAVVALALAALVVLRSLVTFSWPDDGGGPGGLVLIGAVALFVARRADRGSSRRHDRHRCGHPIQGEQSRGEDTDPGNDPTLVLGDDVRAAPPGRTLRPQEDPETRRRRRIHGRVRNGSLLGALVGGAAAALLWATGAWSLGAWVIPAVVLACVIAGLIAAPWVGWSWTLTAATVITIAALAVALVPGVVVRGGVGTRYAQPTTAAAVESGVYRLSAGRQTVDFTALNLASGSRTRADVEVGMGTVELIVPTNVELEIRGHLSAGGVRVDDREVDTAGTNLDLNRTVAPALTAKDSRPGIAADRQPPARITVDIQGGFADVVITRQP